MLSCPRCRTELKEHERSALWCRWFECLSCWSAWHLLGSALLAGKLRRPLGAGRPLGRASV